MRTAALVLTLGLSGLLGCGRGTVLGLSGEGAEPGGSDASSPSQDGAAGGPDGGQTRSDGGTSRDGGNVRDGGPPPSCSNDRDCYEALGPPPCGPGAPGFWSCLSGRCTPGCEEPPVCRTDCDCPPELACLGGRCAPADRRNECCFYGCIENSCVTPNGDRRPCGSPPDAGVPGPDGGPVGTECRDDCDCDRLIGCVNGECAVVNRLNRCCDSPMCPEGQECLLPGGGTSICPSYSPVGQQCSGDFACEPGGVCLVEETGFPGGYCTQSCGPGVQSCPPGAGCRGFGGGEAYCFDLCSSAAECRPGYNCLRLGLAPEPVCWPDLPGSTNPNGLPVGSPCRDAQECDQDLICLTDQDGWRDGYCTKVYCDPVANPCPQGAQCFAFPGSYSLCLSSCPEGGSRSTCRPGYYCLGPTGAPGVCISN